MTGALAKARGELLAGGYGLQIMVFGCLDFVDAMARKASICLWGRDKKLGAPSSDTAFCSFGFYFFFIVLFDLKLCACPIRCKPAYIMTACQAGGLGW